MSKRNLLIALDIDGVLIDFDKHWHAHACDFLGRKLEKQNNAYNFDQRYGISKQDGGKVWDSFNASEQWRTAPLYPGSVEAFKLLQETGADFVYITAANPAVVDMRRDSLQILGADLDIICTGHHGSGTDKREALGAYAPDAFIDDQLINLIHAKELGVGNLGWVDRGDEQLNSTVSPEQWQQVAQYRGQQFMDVAQHVVAALSSTRSLKVAP